MYLGLRQILSKRGQDDELQEVHEAAAGGRGVLPVVWDEAGHGAKEDPDAPQRIRDSVQAGKNMVCPGHGGLADAGWGRVCGDPEDEGRI